MRSSASAGSGAVVAPVAAAVEAGAVGVGAGPAPPQALTRIATSARMAALVLFTFPPENRKAPDLSGAFVSFAGAALRRHHVQRHKGPTHMGAIAHIDMPAQRFVTGENLPAR